MSEAAVAHHEAGHACIAILRGVPVRRCSIEPTRTTSGHMLPAVPNGTIEIADLLVLWLAGTSAEQRFTGRVSVLGETDLQRASALASVQIDAEPDSPAVAAYLKRFQLMADVQVQLHWEWIARVASALVRKRTLDGAQVADLM